MKKVKIITPREWNILARRQAMYNFNIKVIELQTEEMLDPEKGEAYTPNNYAANAAPSEAHAINENKDKSKVEIKDVDTGIDGGKFRIMITYE